MRDTSPLSKKLHVGDDEVGDATRMSGYHKVNSASQKMAANLMDQASHESSRNMISSDPSVNIQGQVTVSNDGWSISSELESYLSTIQTVNGKEPLTSVLIVADKPEMTERLIQALKLTPWSLKRKGMQNDNNQLRPQYPVVAACHDALSGYVYLAMGKECGLPPLHPKLRNALTLSLAASDVVIVTVRLAESTTSSDLIRVPSGYQTLYSTLNTLSTLETELRPSKLVIVGCEEHSSCEEHSETGSCVATLENNEVHSDVSRIIERLLCRTQNSSIPWSWFKLKHSASNRRFGVEGETAAFRNAVAEETPRFTGAVWAGFVKYLWTRMSGTVPTCKSMATSVIDRLQTLEEDLLKRVQSASTTELYQCALLDKIQDAFGKEVDASPEWALIDRDNIRNEFSRNAIKAALNAAHAHLFGQTITKSESHVREIEKSFAKDIEWLRDEELLCKGSEMRSVLEASVNVYLDEYRKAATGLELVKYLRGRRLLGLELSPSTIELTQLG
eukprot:Blabericola_migrator_1__2456@NODE_1691_length_3990_cov_26_202141_g1096_i0_p1_GENE_NODE_1691_length_3990_cov_26_202141_g1096_i0NODE_1691_length_3990_cov_26_202141_g1096_i0_p1_ORF_typecomplete_len504_score78_64_NODE_1691_length_3990_cov_26_202141_g1096_i024403951